MAEYNLLWEQFKKAAAVARRQGNLAKCSRILRESFRECEEQRELDFELIEMAHSLAELQLANGRFAEAESMYRCVLEVREKLLGQTHPDVVESLKQVAIVQIMAFRAEALGFESTRKNYDKMQAPYLVPTCASK